VYIMVGPGVLDDGPIVGLSVNESSGSKPHPGEQGTLNVSTTVLVPALQIGESELSGLVQEHCRVKLYATWFLPGLPPHSVGTEA